MAWCVLLLPLLPLWGLQVHSHPLGLLDWRGLKMKVLNQRRCLKMKVLNDINAEQCARCNASLGEMYVLHTPSMVADHSFLCFWTWRFWIYVWNISASFFSSSFRIETAEVLEWQSVSSLLACGLIMVNFCSNHGVFWYPSVEKLVLDNMLVLHSDAVLACFFCIVDCEVFEAGCCKL